MTNGRHDFMFRSFYCSQSGGVVLSSERRFAAQPSHGTTAGLVVGRRRLWSVVDVGKLLLHRFCASNLLGSELNAEQGVDLGGGGARSELRVSAVEPFLFSAVRRCRTKTLVMSAIAVSSWAGVKRYFHSVFMLSSVTICTLVSLFIRLSRDSLIPLASDRSAACRTSSSLFRSPGLEVSNTGLPSME